MANEAPLVLIVDDNPRNLQFLGALLTEKGYELGVAQNGTEALAFVKEREPHLILLDIMMPGMDGFAVCASLKKDMRTSHIPIIILTARTEVDDIVKGFAAGASDYVTKPFIAAELLARIRTHLEIKQLRHLLPVCAQCKKVRDEEGLWQGIDEYIWSHTATKFSHGLCDECIRELYGESMLTDDPER